MADIPNSMIGGLRRRRNRVEHLYEVDQSIYCTRNFILCWFAAYTEILSDKVCIVDGDQIIIIFTTDYYLQTSFCW